MGDFDRNPTPGDKAGETKKLVAVACLGAALIGVLVWQYTKNNAGGPQAAAGAPSPTGVDLPMPEPASDFSQDELNQRCAKLQADPTSQYLVKNARDDHSFDVPPHSPFAMDPNWLKSLIKPAEVVESHNPTLPVGPDPVRPATAPAAMVYGQPKAEDYKLNGVINGVQAIITYNGKQWPCVQGSRVGKAVVVKVTSDLVTLRLADAPESAPTLELSMNPAISSGGN